MEESPGVLFLKKRVLNNVEMLSPFLLVEAGKGSTFQHC
jgi:hypothetical protein